MTGRPRILFADTAVRPSWSLQPNRFEACAALAAEAGFDVVLATTGSEGDGRPAPASSSGVTRLAVGTSHLRLVCGIGRASETRPLREAYALAQAVDLSAFDVVVAPVGGGLAHGLLMRRSTGDSPANTRVALWCDAPTRWRMLHEDVSPGTAEPLVADALERMAVRTADALLAPSAAAVARLDGLGAPPPSIPARLALERQNAPPPPSSGPVEEIVFVGPLTRANGALLFMDAIEQLVTRDELGPRRVAFVGPAAETGPHWSQELLGVRASRWPFAFRIANRSDPRAILDELSTGRKLAVFAAEDDDDDRLLRAAVACGCPVVASRGYDLTRAGGRGIADGGADRLADLLCGRCADGWVDPMLPPPTDWPAVLRLIMRLPTRVPPPSREEAIGRLTVCTVSKHRPQSLAAALDSVAAGRHPVDVAVLDNASPEPIHGGELARATRHPLRVIRSERHQSPAAAYNRLVEAAEGDAVLFLDDDNVLTPNGLARFIAALDGGWFDVVVSTLDLVDGEAATGASAGRFVFIGEAASAGLVFNGFGDRGMAVRRRTFLDLGGFPDAGYHSPVSDWAFLARAQAAGCRIGVLQEPALRYARRLAGTEDNWLKQDLEGGRRLVHEAYGSHLDGPMLARYAQGLQLRAL